MSTDSTAAQLCSIAGDRSSLRPVRVSLNSHPVWLEQIEEPTANSELSGIQL